MLSHLTNNFFSHKILFLIFILMFLSTGMTRSAAASEKPPSQGRIMVPAGQKIDDNKDCGWWCRSKWRIIIGSMVAVAVGGVAYLLTDGEKDSDGSQDKGTVIYEW